MYAFDLSHVRDPNNFATGSHAIKQQTSSPVVQLGIVEATDPVNHTANVKMLGYRGNNNTPLVLRNIKVAVDQIGQTNLPAIGQQVEIVFENGISFSPSKAFIGRRFYTTAHRPPSHPIFLDNSSYQKSVFEQAEGGSYKFKKADGSVTEFGATTRSKEGSKENARATGVAKTSTEALMESSQQKTALANKQLTTVANSTTNLADLARQKSQLATIEAEQKLKKAKPAPGTDTPEENNKIDLWFYNITDGDQLDDLTEAAELVSSSVTRKSFNGDEAVLVATKAMSNAAYLVALKAAIATKGISIAQSAIRRGASFNSQGNVPSIRIEVQ